MAEELNVSIVVHQSLAPVTHAYPAFTITLYPFICSIAAGDIKLHEHAAVVWLPRNQLFTLDWAEADLPVVDAYCRLFLKTEP
jgi:8-oxo-dGTP diphosphatase